MNRIVASVLLATAAALPVTTYAHHSFAMFDNQKEMTVTGVVKDFQWTNPHCWIQLLVTDASGAQHEWGIEGQSPNGLLRQGWTRKSIKAGDKAVVVLHPLKDGTPGGSIVSVTIDGQRIGTAGGPPADASPTR